MNPMLHVLQLSLSLSLLTTSSVVDAFLPSDNIAFKKPQICRTSPPSITQHSALVGDLGAVDIALAGGVFAGSMAVTIWKGLQEDNNGGISQAVATETANTMTVAEAMAKVAEMEEEEEEEVVVEETPAAVPAAVVAVVEEKMEEEEEELVAVPVAASAPAAPTVSTVEKDIAAVRREVASTLPQVREAESRQLQASGLFRNNDVAAIAEEGEETSSTTESSLAASTETTSEESSSSVPTSNRIISFLQAVLKFFFKILTFWKRTSTAATTETNPPPAAQT